MLAPLNGIVYTPADEQINCRDFLIDSKNTIHAAMNEVRWSNFICEYFYYLVVKYFFYFDKKFNLLILNLDQKIDWLITWFQFHTQLSKISITRMVRIHKLISVYQLINESSFGLVSKIKQWEKNFIKPSLILLYMYYKLIQVLYMYILSFGIIISIRIYSIFYLRGIISLRKSP